MMRYLLMIAILFISTSACAQTKVGGTCDYDEFPGECTVTQVDPEGTVNFTYEGEVEGDAIVLSENTGTIEGPVGTVVDCTLQFITEGTCTPCLFSVGSCGQEAWAAYTAWAATRAVSTGCSLVR